MPSLPTRPNLEHLKKQAKHLLHDCNAGEAGAVDRMRAANLEAGATPTLADAQHIIAREHGFTTWAELKASVESLQAAVAGQGDSRTFEFEEGAI